MHIIIKSKFCYNSRHYCFSQTSFFSGIKCFQNILSAQVTARNFCFIKCVDRYPHPLQVKWTIPYKPSSVIKLHQKHAKLYLLNINKIHSQCQLQLKNIPCILTVPTLPKAVCVYLTFTDTDQTDSSNAYGASTCIKWNP